YAAGAVAGLHRHGMAGGSLKVDQGAVGHSDHAGAGVDCEAATGVVGQAEDDTGATGGALGIARAGPEAHGRAVGSAFCYAVGVAEGAANGTTVGLRASASDPKGTAGGAGVIFSLTNDAGGRFAIDASTGVVTVANSALIDFETATSHTVAVQASDGAGGI